MRRLALVLLVAAACSREAPPSSAPSAPIAPAAAVAIEPPRLRVGDVAIVEVSVVTPPGHRVAAIRPPDAIDGLWVLDAEALPLESDGVREVRRTRVRVRARAAGAAEWPPLEIEVEKPDGAKLALATEARPLEIVTVLPPEPESAEPYAFRLPAPPARSTSHGVAALAGAGAAFAAVGLVAAGRRVRRRARARAEAERALAAAQPWIEARAALEAARALGGDAWRAAAAAGAVALRRYLALRFAVPAAASAAVEELAALRRPLLSGERWQAALACLRDLDGDRFRARPDAESAARVARALEAADAFVRATTPGGAGDEAQP